MSVSSIQARIDVVAWSGLVSKKAVPLDFSHAVLTVFEETGSCLIQLSTLAGWGYLCLCLWPVFKDFHMPALCALYQWQDL